MKPILFNTEMVRAILDGRKTVTRRLVKPQPEGAHTVLDYDEEAHTADILCGNGGENGVFLDWAETVKAPYWAGDILWVRETWTREGKEYFYRADFDSDYLDPCETLSGGYPSDCVFHPGCDGCMRGPQRIRWHPSIHMPREAARLFLRVTDVRVERLQDITENEAISEGVPDEWPMSPVYCPHCKGEGLVGAVHPVSLGYMDVECPYCEKATVRFANLWNSTIKPKYLPTYGWEANPWVWVIEFERTRKEEQQ